MTAAVAAVAAESPAVAEADTASATAAVAADDVSLTSVFTGAAKTAAPATTERVLAGD